MWKTISTNDEIMEFMETMCYFHDSCIKEISYLSGAYVNNNLSMFPLNTCRILRLIIQRQSAKNSMIEMEFSGLKCLKLFPVDENSTCELLGATMFLKGEDFYWCDCDDVSELNLNDYTGTLICATTLRWRPIKNHMGEREFFYSEV